MIPEFFKKLMFSRQFYYEKGRLTIYNMPGVMMPVDVMAHIIKHQLDQGKKGEKMLYEAGYKQGEKALDIIGSKFGFIQKKLISVGIETLTITGWGVFEAKRVDLKKKHAIFHLKNSTVASAYKKIFKKSKKPIDYYLAGLFAGSGSKIIKADLKCVETKCVAKGDSYCEFELKEA